MSAAQLSVTTVQLLRRLDQGGRWREFYRAQQEEAAAAEEAEELSRKLLKADREQWKKWLRDEVMDALERAYERLDAARARVRELQEGR
jgi:LPS sulfotransferase NodH